MGSEVIQEKDILSVAAACVVSVVSVFFTSLPFKNLKEHCRVVKTTEKRKDSAKETFDVIITLNFSENGPLCCF